MKHLKKLQQNNSGMVAIMVATFLVLVVSLVVVNYSQLVRREQRQVLDRQLNTQALYVAESGIEQIKEQLLDPDVPRDYTKPAAVGCGDHIEADYQITNASLGPDLEVTCSIVTNAVETIEREGVSELSEIIPIDPDGGTVNQITINWTNNSGIFNVSGCSYPDLPTAFPVNCTPGIIKVDIVDTSSLNRDTILANTYTAYLYPSSSGTTSTSIASGNSPSEQGNIIQTNCGSGPCSMRITGLSSGRYHMRIQSIYNESNVQIVADGVMGGVSGRLTLYNADAIIDVTARAVDVIRRVRATVAISGYEETNSTPTSAAASAALQTADSICKSYFVDPGTEVSGCEIP